MMILQALGVSLLAGTFVYLGLGAIFKVQDFHDVQVHLTGAFSVAFFIFTILTVLN